MKTCIRRAIAITLLLGTQIFAQKFTAAEPDTIETGYNNGSANYGYLPNNYQSAVLGKKKSVYANYLLLKGRDTLLSKYGNEQEAVGTYNVVNSYGDVFGVVRPLVEKNVYLTAKGDTVYDGISSGVVVLDSMSDTKKSAIAVFSTFRKITVVQIELGNANAVTQTILNSFNLPDDEIAKDGSYNTVSIYRRLALLGASQTGNGKLYHLATSNPLSPNGTFYNAGRVGFFSIVENTWAKSQPNTTGISSGTNGLSFENETKFGTDLVAIGDLDKNGYNDLAVLAPKSAQHPQSAIYIFFMENESTPSVKEPIVLTGNSLPWKKSAEEYALTENGLAGKLSEHSQDCNGLGFAEWGGEGHLLVSCNAVARFAASKDSSSRSVIVKDLVLNSDGYISKSTVLFAKSSPWHHPQGIFSEFSTPLPIANHRNSNAISLIVDGPVSYAAKNYLYSMPIVDADFSKNFSIEAGKEEIIANLDSLFYRSGTSGFSAQTIYGLAKCQVKNETELQCEGEESAIGSWSAVELASKSGCDSYMPCKRKDTVHIYIRSQSEPKNTALRISKSVVFPIQAGIFTWENLNSLAYFRNPNLQNTSISWNETALKQSAVSSGAGVSQNGGNSLSVIPIAQNGGIDTLVFNLTLSTQTDNYKVLLHIADSSKILANAITQTPGNSDTVFNTINKKYIELPAESENGNIYTYDIKQSGLGEYAEITGNYIHILKVDFATVTLAYTENGQLKQRKIALTPESKASTPSSSSSNSGSSSSSSENETDGDKNGGGQSPILSSAPSLQDIPADATIRIYDLKGNLTQSMNKAGVYIVQVRSKGVTVKKIAVVK